MLSLCASPEDMERLISGVAKEGVAADSASFTITARAFLKLGRNVEATATLEAMAAAGFKPGAGLRNRMKAIALDTASGGSENAVVVANEYGRRIIKMQAGRNIERAWKFFEEAVASGHANTYLMNVMMRSCEAPADAIALMSRLKGLDINPDAVTFTTLIARHALAGEKTLAEAVLVDMRVAGYEPEAQTWRALGYVKNLL